MIQRTLIEIQKMIKGSHLKGGDSAIHGVSIDSRTTETGNLFIPIIGPNSNGHNYIESAMNKGAVASLWQKNEPNPPEDIPLIYVDDTLVALQQLASAYRQQLTEATFIGITGSNGKTSIKDMLHSVLSTTFKTQKTAGNFNNEIGVPLTLLSLDEDVEMAVIEMGMSGLGEIAFLSNMVKPDIAVISNIGKAHLVDLGSLQNIAKAKMEIVKGLHPSGYLFLNGDEHILMKEAEINSCKKITFGKSKRNNLYLTSSEQKQLSIHFNISERACTFTLPLIGEHQAINCLPVIKIAEKLHIHDENIQAGLNNVVLTGQRNEVTTIDEVTIINDTYKSNPESVKAAIDTLDSLSGSKRKLLIIGDMVDMGEEAASLHEQIGMYLIEKNIDAIYGVGSLTEKVIQTVKQYAPDKKAIHFSSETHLTTAILEYAKKPSILLFKASRVIHLEDIVDHIEKRLVT